MKAPKIGKLVARECKAIWALTRTLRLLTLLGLSGLAAHAQEMVDGSAIVTSCSGSVSATDSSGTRASVDAHTVVRPAELSLSTQKDGQLFLTFSNGVALGLEGDTSIQCLEYKQRPFNKQEQSLGLEPSVSELRLQFAKGQLAIASNRLSPLSSLRIRLPFGELRLHKGSCLLKYDSTGLHVTAFEGNLTYYYPNGEREFVAAPKSVRISEQSAERQQIAEASTVESIDPEATQLCLATQYASSRVLFQPNKETGLPPVPVLVVRPEYFEQAPMRPYTFED